GGQLSQYTYRYDPAGRVTGETRSSQVGTVVYQGTIGYSYDLTHQLTSDGPHTYSYDPAGNRTAVVTSQGTTSYQTGPANRVASDGTWTYTYDPEGNLVTKRNPTSGELWTYTYDHRNRLTTASQTLGSNSFSVSYVYDVAGHRVEQVSTATGDTRFG